MKITDFLMGTALSGADDRSKIGQLFLLIGPSLVMPFVLMWMFPALAATFLIVGGCTAYCLGAGFPHFVICSLIAAFAASYVFLFRGGKM